MIVNPDFAADSSIDMNTRSFCPRRDLCERAKYVLQNDVKYIQTAEYLWSLDEDSQFHVRRKKLEAFAILLSYGTQPS